MTGDNYRTASPRNDITTNDLKIDNITIDNYDKDILQAVSWKAEGTNPEGVTV